MSRADMEAVLQELAATTRYLQDSGRLMREAAEHLTDATDRIIAVNDHLKEMSDRTSAAITAGLNALHGEDE